MWSVLTALALRRYMRSGRLGFRSFYARFLVGLCDCRPRAAERLEGRLLLDSHVAHAASGLVRGLSTDCRLLRDMVVRFRACCRAAVCAIRDVHPAGRGPAGQRLDAGQFSVALDLTWHHRQLGYGGVVSVRDHAASRGVLQRLRQTWMRDGVLVLDADPPA